MTLVTPAGRISEWTINTMEQPRIHRRLVAAGVELLPDRDLLAVEGGEARLRDTLTDRESALPVDALVLVTARLPNDALALELGATAIGDAYAPGTIATAVWDGRRYAEELDGEPHGDGVPFRREVVELAPLGDGGLRPMSDDRAAREDDPVGRPGRRADQGDRRQPAQPDRERARRPPAASTGARPGGCSRRSTATA